MRKSHLVAAACLAAAFGVALVCFSSPAAAADCRVNPYRFFPAQNDSVATTAVLTGGGSCIHRFLSASMLQFTSASVASRPANGTLEQRPLRFRYRPKPGFKGSDQYSVKVCGTSTAGSGCSTISYGVSVQ
jgi:hypothetical protein